MVVPRALAVAALCLASASAAAAPMPLPEALIAARAEAALTGGLLADAAAMPLHWIYSQSEIANLVGSGEPEFYKTPSCPFYNYKVGDSTPYGQQMQAYLQVGAASGAFAPADVEKAYSTLYSAAPAYWYKDESTKEFIANVAAGRHWPQCGGNDNQADALVHALPVVALMAGKGTAAMLAVVDSTVRVTQNTDDGVAFGLAAARVFEYVIAYNLSGVAAVTQAIADLQDPARASPYSEDAALARGMQNALANVGESTKAFCAKIGQSCDYPFNLFTGSQLVAQLGASPADYLSGVRQTILAGGDSGSRNFFVGAMQAAKMGDVALLPASWPGKCSEYAAAAPLIKQLVAHRSSV